MTRLRVDDLAQLSRLQMAAEANLSKIDSKGEPKEELASSLREGNRRSSKFTEADAVDFAEDWRLLSHVNNTLAGFSGAVFQNRHTQQTVMSLRSTEFIDDAVRDNMATNALEIRNTGFAWGQLSDLQKWYGELKQRGVIAMSSASPASLT